MSDHTSKAGPRAPEAMPENWRETLLQRLLVALTPISVAALTMGIIGSHGYSRALFVVGLVPLVALQVGAAFAKQWPYRLRAVILVTPFALATVLTYYVLGFRGNASVLGACAIALTGLLFGRREVAGLLAALALVPVAVGAAVLGGWLTLEDGLDISPAHVLPWIRTSFVAYAAWALLGLAITFVVQRVEGELLRTREALAALREEQSLRAKAESERRLAEDAALQAQKMELVGRLAAGVAHDFNNLLAVVGSWAELSFDELATPSDREQGRHAIAGSIQQGTALTRQLLALARRDSRTVARVRLEQVVRAGVRTLSRVLPAGVNLRFEEQGSAQVDADEAELQQVLFNLVLNARDAMPNSGSIVVTTEVVTLSTPLSTVQGELGAGEWARLTVKDTGAGIEPELRDRIFELFFTTKPIGLGTGIGLATVLRIAQASGGGVTLESSPGQGSTFSLLLPIAAASENP